MLTGRRAFGGHGVTTYDVVTRLSPYNLRSCHGCRVTAIIREDPEPLPPSTPTPLRWVIERLLAKDPADRYDSTR